MNWAGILQVASGLGGLTVVIAILSLPWTLKKIRSDTRKTDADAAKVLSESAIAFLAPARAEIGELERRLRSANQRVNSLEEALRKSEQEVATLRTQVGQMTKDMTELRDENERLRDQKPWRP
jgi:septal ring factor EnvC (AmiA/AmiB activator)